MRSDAKASTAGSTQHRAAALAFVTGALGALALAPGASAAGVPGGPYTAVFGPEAGSCAFNAVAVGSGDFDYGEGSGDVSGADGIGYRTEGSPLLVDVVANQGAFEPGQEITGTGIKNETTIVAVEGDTITMSKTAGSGEKTHSFISAGKTEVTNVSTAGGEFAVGQGISGEGMRVDTTITEVGAETLTLSKRANGGGPGTPLYAATNEVTNVSTECGTFEAGQTVFDPVFVADTYIEEVGAGTLTLSKPPIAGTTGVTISAATAFGSNKPNGLAFDQGAERLYALDNRVDELYAYPSPGLVGGVAGFPIPIVSSGLHFASSIGVDNSAEPSAGRLYYAAADDETVYAFDAEGTELTSPAHPAFPFHIKGTGTSNAQLCGVGVDSEANFWIGDSLNYGSLSNSFYRIRKYSPNGAFLGEITVPGDRAASCRMAFDSEDNLYVTGNNNQKRNLWKYTAETGYDPSVAELLGPGWDVVYDADTDRLYVLQKDKATILTTEGGELGEFATGISEAEFRGIAVDEANDRVYISDSRSERIYAFGYLTTPDAEAGGIEGVSSTESVLRGTVNPLSIPVTECRFDYTTEADWVANKFANAISVECDSLPGEGASPVEVSAGVGGLTPGGDYRVRMVAANENGKTFGAAVPFAALGPQVKGESFEATATNATLEAQVNPNGEATSYHFEYVSQEAFEESGFAGAAVVPAAPVGIGDGSSYVAVSQQIGGLKPATAYRFRTVATNPSDTVIGSGAGFTTILYDGSACANAALRTGPSAELPDCRAYEMVSPVDKNGYDVLIGPAWVLGDGSTAAYISKGSFGEFGAGASPNVYGATRGDDWRSIPMQPTWGTESQGIGSPIVLGATRDLSRALVLSNVALAPGGVEGGGNIYVHNIADHTYEHVATADEEVIFIANEIHFVGASADNERIFFRSSRDLESIPPTTGEESEDLFEFSGGQLKAAGIRPSGLVAPNSTAPNSFLHPLSDDGNRYYFSQAITGGTIQYLRDGEETVKLPLEGTFVGASADALIAYYSNGEGLHRYDAVADTVSTIVEAPMAKVFGVGRTGDYVYFASSSALAGAPPVDCGTAQAGGRCNLFVWHDGEVRFIGTLASLPNVFKSDGRVSANGRYFGFVTRSRFDGPHPQAQQPFEQAYLYDYQADTLSCASCPPEGVEQVADVKLATDIGGVQTFEVGMLDNPPELSRNVSDAGQLFFETDAPLVPGDSNGEGSGCPPVNAKLAVALGRVCQDVYEYQAGKAYLISTGNAGPSYFDAATASGDDVYFSSGEAGLVGQDRDDLIDVFVAKVGGGLVSQNAVTPPTCEGEGCRGAGSPTPQIPGAGSAVFEGPNNRTDTPPKTCPGGKVRRGKRCRSIQAIARRRCRRLRGRAKRRCIRKQVARLNGAQRRQRRAKRRARTRAANLDRRSAR